MGRADRIPNRAVMSTHRWIPRAVPILGLTDRHLAAVPASARTAAVGFRLASHSCRDRMAVNLAAHQHSPHDARNRLPPRPDRRLSVARPRHPASASSAGDATPGPIAPTSRLAGSSRSANSVLFRSRAARPVHSSPRRRLGSVAGCSNTTFVAGSPPNSPARKRGDDASGSI